MQNVAIALESIKKAEVLEDRGYLNNKEVAHSSLSATISIRDLLKNVNPKDKNFYKYIPKQIFNEDVDTNKNLISNPDIRFDYLVKPSTLTEGKVAKKVANYSRAKVFSKNEAEKVVNDIIESIELEGKTVILSGKDSKEAINAVWISWNSQDIKDHVKTAFNIADFIINQLPKIFILMKKIKQSGLKKKATPPKILIVTYLTIQAKANSHIPKLFLMMNLWQKGI